MNMKIGKSGGLIALLMVAGSCFGQTNIIDFTEATKVNGGVNSDYEESMPVFSKDSSVLYFTRTYDPKSTGGEYDQDIWYSVKDASGVYGPAQRVKELNNKLHNAVFGVNKDGSAIYLFNAYEGKKDMEKGISMANKKGKKWAKPEKINIPGLVIEGDFYGFHVNEEETIILLTYKGPNTVGNEDLYVVFRQNDGSWKEPLNLGTEINTEGYEMSPFLSPAMDTMYFTSDRPGGFGDGDVYFSVRQDESWTKWSAPVNLGPKINTPRFDAFFIRTGNTVYWSSNRETIRAEIYTARVLPPPIPDLTASAVATDATVYQGTDGKIDLTVEGGVGPYTYQWSNGMTVEDPEGLARGEYLVTVTDTRGKTVEISVFVSEPEPVDVAINNPPADDFKIEDRIYFDLNSSFLNKENRKTLNALLKQLKEHPELKIFVESHCDERASDHYNVWLSERRMNRTIDYLVAGGVPRDKISGSYKGEREPDIKCNGCSEEQYTKNRRTTITARK
jgi:outer membrane protein OmpA-like peptidoglycan-associated protein